MKFGTNPIVAGWYLDVPIGFPEAAQTGDSVAFDMFKANYLKDLPDPLIPIVARGQVVVGVVEAPGQIRFDPSELTRNPSPAK